MTEYELRSQLTGCMGGTFLAAAALMRAIDAPGATIESVRAGKAAKLFREQLADFRRWMESAIQTTPDLQPEEQRFLDYWVREKNRVPA
jgi:hypothetical protein